MVPMDTRVVQGYDAVINCVAMGYPQPIISWSWRWGDESAALVDDDDFDLLANGSVRILAVQDWQLGIYTCRAHSDLGETEASAQLYMLGQY